MSRSSCLVLSIGLLVVVTACKRVRALPRSILRCAKIRLARTTIGVIAEIAEYFVDQPYPFEFEKHFVRLQIVLSNVECGIPLLSTILEYLNPLEA